MVASHPEIAQAMVNLHRRYRIATDQLAAATDERGDRSMRGTISAPHEEVRDYFYQRRNYIHELDIAAEEMTNRMRMHSADIRREIMNRIENVHGISIVRRVDLGDYTLHRLNSEERRLEFSAALSAGQRTFKLASELCYLEYHDLLDELVDQGNFTSEDARSLALLGLANYFAAAVVLPLQPVPRRGRRFPLRHRTALSVLRGVLRDDLPPALDAATPQPPRDTVVVRPCRPRREHVETTVRHRFPLFLQRRHLPLWNVYETFASPGKILTQIAEMPDGRNYFWVARTVERRAARYGQPGKTFAIGMGCELRHAGRVIYSDGLEIGPQAHVTPIGAGCRVCERTQCAQRAFPRPGRHTARQRTLLHGVAVHGDHRDTVRISDTRWWRGFPAIDGRARWPHRERPRTPS